MEIAQVVVVAFIATVLVVVVRQSRPDLGMQLSIAAGILIFLFVIPKFIGIVSFFGDMSRQARIDVSYLDTVLKVIGVAYLTEFGAQVCRDAGEGAIATKVELAGKITILLLAIPVIAGIMELILRLLP